MSILEAALLGILQGLTEFLPVSSSGHLVLGEAFLGVDDPGPGFEVFAHVGTLLAILIHYRRDLAAMAGSVVRVRRDEHLRDFLLILLASVPTIAVVVLAKERIEALFDRPRWAAAFLLVTGAMLLSTRLARAGSGRVGPLSGLFIGIGQAMALLPGISRSGATISAGIFAGVERERAARFSFLLVVPALVGAAALTLREGMPAGGAAAAWTVGAITAFASGYVALKWLLAAVARDRFPLFGFYCLAVGVVALAVLLPQA